MSAPIVELNDVTVFADQTIAAADLFTASTSDFEITSYTFYDFRGDLGTGGFEKDGVAISNGGSFTITSDELSTIRYRGGSDIRFEGFKIVARNSVGEFSSSEVRGRIYTVRENTTAPHVRAPRFTLLANETFKGSDFVWGYDPDGYPLTEYEVIEGSKLISATASNGVVTVIGYQHRFDDGQTVTLSGANESTYNISGNINRIDQHVFTIDAPGIADGSATGELFGSTDDGNFFAFNGTRLPQGQRHTIPAEQLDLLTYSTFGNNSEENFYVRGYDGVDWSFEKKGIANAITNANVPVVQLAQASTPANARFSVGTSFSVIDADENTMKKYQFRNLSVDPAQGDLYRGNARMPRETWFDVSAEDLNTVFYESSFIGDTHPIQVRAFDGLFWSDPGQVVIRVTPPIIRPELTPLDPVILSEQLEFIPARSLFFKSDIGPAHDRVEVYEPSTLSGSGVLREGISALPAATVHQFSSFVYSNFVGFSTADASGRSNDLVYQRSMNVHSWSRWEKTEVRTEPEYDSALVEEGNPTWSTVGFGIIPYSFMQDFPDYETGDASDDDAPDNFEPFTIAQRDTARETFATIEKYVNVQFLEVSDSEINGLGGRGGYIRLGEYGDDGEMAPVGFAFAPPLDFFEAIDLEERGDIWINRRRDPDMADNGFPQDSEERTWLFRLIGQALGLKPSNTGTPRLPIGVDSRANTVMTARGGSTPNTIQLYDILELQEIYGVNFATGAGDSVYSIFREWGRTSFVETIWDASGNDTLSAVGSSKDSVVDIREGQVSSIGDLTNNVTIAYGTQIEHGIGSIHNDSLIGNPVDNVLIGFAGNDFLMGNQGNDVLLGGEGDDTYEWGLGDHNDTINEQGSAGRDTLRITDFPTVDSLSDDFRFAMEGENLVVELALENGPTEGTVKVVNQTMGGFRVETMELAGLKIDLANLASQLSPGDLAKRFTVTAEETDFGFMVTPVI